MLTKNEGFYREGTLKIWTLFTSKFQNAEVAQSVEQGTENPRVGSSILSLGTRKRSKNKGLAQQR